MSALAALAMRLPEELGIELRIWRAPDEDNVLGIVWEVYAVKRAQADYPTVGDANGWTIEGPLQAAHYIEEQLTGLGILPALEGK